MSKAKEHKVLRIGDPGVINEFLSEGWLVSSTLHTGSVGPPLILLERDKPTKNKPIVPKSKQKGTK